MSDQTTDLDNRFRYHAPRTEERAQAHTTIRETLCDVAHQLVGVVPSGREQSLMLTKLEEAMFWANAGLARTPDTDAG